MGMIKDFLTIFTAVDSDLIFKTIQALRNLKRKNAIPIKLAKIIRATREDFTEHAVREFCELVLGKECALHYQTGWACIHPGWTPP